MPYGRRSPLCAASFVLVFILSLAVTVPSEAAPDPAAKCTTTKRGAAARKVAGKLNCVARPMTKGGMVDPVCLAKAESKFSSTFAKAESKGGCLSTGDAAAVEANVDACVTDIRQTLGVPGSTLPASKCTGAKVKAAGRKTTSKINCYNAGVTKGTPVNPICLSKAESTFMGGFAKAEAKGDCLTSGDAAAVEGDVDSCVAAIRAAVPQPSTTTTSTTSSTTTTTVCDAEAMFLTGITSAHNTERANASPAPNPALSPLCYSATVASTAQNWANQCTWGHNPSTSYGENIAAYTNSGTGDLRSTAAASALNDWAAEASCYNYASNTCSSSPPCDGVCGHYTQVVWDSTQRLGCGIQYCTANSPFGSSFPNWTIVVCDYNPPGNFVGQRPY